MTDIYSRLVPRLLIPFPNVFTFPSSCLFCSSTLFLVRTFFLSTETSVVESYFDMSNRRRETFELFSSSKTSLKRVPVLIRHGRNTGVLDMSVMLFTVCHEFNRRIYGQNVIRNVKTSSVVYNELYE